MDGSLECKIEGFYIIAHMYVCVYVCVCECLCVYVLKFVCMCVCMCVYMCAYVCTYVRTCICMYVCIYIYWNTKEINLSFFVYLYDFRPRYFNSLPFDICQHTELTLTQ